MFETNFFSIIFSLLMLVTQSVFAAVPYIPSHVFLSPRHNGSLAYVLRPKPSTQNEVQFLSLNASGTLDAANPQYSVLSDSIPFLGDDDDGVDASVPAIDSEGIIKVYTGDCRNSASRGAVWSFIPDNSSLTGDGKWEKSDLQLDNGTADDDIQGPNYLAAGFAYSASNDTASSLYSFGGMCPFGRSSDQNWVSAANYSQSMTMLDPSGSSSDASYALGVIPTRGPPIPEAGFTITPLQATYSTTSAGKVLQKDQSFLLIGGHTAQAFINMSGMALFSLPENTWNIIDINQQPDPERTDLAIRDTAEVEPRSGHSAVLSPDGSKVIVFGGWVGDMSVPAEPQLAVLEIGEAYGGSGPWTWSVPSQQGTGLPQGTGIFGHGATILPGGVMMIVGGYRIAQPSSRRSTPGMKPNSQIYLYNITSNTWITSYTNPNQQSSENSESSSSPLSSTAQKTGLGVGLGVGLAIVIAIVIAPCLLRFRRRQLHRRSRDQELRKLALGAERSHFFNERDMQSSFYAPMTQVRPASIPGCIPDSAYPWAGNRGFGDGSRWQDSGGSNAERTGLLVDIPSPTRGLRRSMHSRPCRRYSGGRYYGVMIVAGPGHIHPIDERDEDEANTIREPDLECQQAGQRDSREYEMTDPFSGPRLSPRLLQVPPEEEKEPTAQGWGDETEHLYDGGFQNRSGSTSPDKNDRTSSNLSQSSASTHSAPSIRERNFRPVTKRSPDKPTIRLVPSSTPSFDPPSSSSSWERQSPEDVRPKSSHKETYSQDSEDSVIFPFQRSNTVDTFDAAHKLESELLLCGDPGRLTTSGSSSKSIVGSAKVLGWMGSVRRSLLVGAQRKPTIDRALAPSPMTATSEKGSIVSCPIKGLHDNGLYLKPSEVMPRRTVSASSALLKRKQGARDWLVDTTTNSKRASVDLSRGSTYEPLVHDSSGSGHSISNGVDSELTEDYDYDDEDWDIEAAAEGRVVQVTYTVPKEKLRVVNPGVGDMDDDDDDDDADENTHMRKGPSSTSR
ncbi:hypothetical protein VTN00DRAFT_1296 [Thermoascus crustaceus]|uniref:uncharacterized protein n=1 Tax=Thermoascus crustaceus TaxID=5088 RepID=UPI003743EDF9